MKKRNSIVIILFTLLAISVAWRADAQFWKKKSRKKHKHEQIIEQKIDSANVSTPQHELTKKEKRKKEKEEKKRLKKEKKHNKERNSATAKKTARPVIPTVKKREDIIFPPTHFKPRYRIDVLATLYLDELVKGKYITFGDKIPDKAFPGVSFVQGVNIAADSLKRAGYNVDIYVHDAASFQESAEALIRQGKLDTTDLIIGAVPAQDIATLAAFAKKKQIYFISATGVADGGVKDNQYFTLLQPSLYAHCDWIIKDIAKKYHGKKVTLLYRNSIPAESNAFAWLTADSSEIAYQYLLCSSMPKIVQLLSLFDTTGTNIVIVPVMDNAYADSLLKILSRSAPDARFEVYGMPSWSGIADLYKPKAFPNVAVNITAAFDFDPATVSGKYIERNFKRDYSGKPSELVYLGYEALLWYSNLLKSYGTVFKYSDNAPAPFTPFEISPQWNNNNDLLYNENKHIFLTRYENGNRRAD